MTAQPSLFGPEVSATDAELRAVAEDLVERDPSGTRIAEVLRQIAQPGDAAEPTPLLPRHESLTRRRRVLDTKIKTAFDPPERAGDARRC